MKIEMSTVLMTIDDEPLKMNEKDMLLKDACIRALFAVSNDDLKKQSGQEKFDRYTLGLKINKGGVVDLTPEEVVKLRKLVGDSFGPSVIGPAWTALEGEKD